MRVIACTYHDLAFGYVALQGLRTTCASGQYGFCKRTGALVQSGQLLTESGFIHLRSVIAQLGRSFSHFVEQILGLELRLRVYHLDDGI